MANKQNKPKLRAGRPTKHAGYLFLRTGDMPPERRYLVNHLENIRAGLIRDLGPTEKDLTTAQRLLIDRVIAKLGILRLIEEHASENGFFDGDSLAPSLRESYISWDNSIRLALRELGISKKATETIDIVDIGRDLCGTSNKKEG